MAIGPAYANAFVDAVVGVIPAGSVVRIYSGLGDDPTAPPDPADEMPTAGGYAPAEVPTFPAAADGYTFGTADFGTSTDEWTEIGERWAITDPTDPTDVVLYDRIQTLTGERVVEVTDAGTPVTVDLFIYPRPADQLG